MKIQDKNPKTQTVILGWVLGACFAHRQMPKGEALTLVWQDRQLLPFYQNYITGGVWVGLRVLTSAINPLFILSL